MKASVHIYFGVGMIQINWRWLPTKASYILL